MESPRNVDKSFEDNEALALVLLKTKSVDQNVTDIVLKRKDRCSPVDEASKSKTKRLRAKVCVVKMETEEGIVDKVVFTNCKPHLFLHNGKDEIKLTAAQLSDVKAIGFDGLLKVKFGKFPSGIIPYLVAHFDSVNRVQHIPNKPGYIITADDVYDILGLPLNPGKQIMCKTKKCENTFDDWLNKLGFQNVEAVKAKNLLALFSRYPEGGDDFKKIFVLYSLCLILAPLPDFRLRRSIYPAIADAATIQSFDWCSFVLDTLCESIRRVNSDNSVKYVNGCVLILLFCYCYRFPYQGKPYSRSLPLVKNISEKLMKSRFEVEKAKGFGRGVLVLDGLPITHQYTNWCKRSGDELEDNKKDEVVQEIVAKEPSEERFVKYMLNERWSTDEELRSKAKDELELAELILKRDAEVITDAYYKRVKAYKARRDNEEDD
ncbi:unnamed protein product [Amaranthus hypochondriacus]